MRREMDLCVRACTAVYQNVPRKGHLVVVVRGDSVIGKILQAFMVER